MKRLLLALCAVLAGCLTTPTEQCGELICPGDTVCVAELNGCYPPDQVAPCQGQPDGQPCVFGGVAADCRTGVCVVPTCGDGLLTPPEACDGEDLGGQSCASLGYYDGSTLACQDDCTFDESGCDGRCGDGVVNGPEFCDAAPPASFDCSNFAFDYGTLECTAICAPTTEACVRFGLTPVPQPVVEDLHSVSGYGGELYTISESGLYRKEQTGWSQIALPDAGAVLNDVFAAADAIWVVGRDGAVFKIENGMATAVDVGATSDLYEIWVASDGQVWIGGETELIHFDGSAWRNRTADSQASGPFTAFWGSSPDNVYIGAQDRLVRFDGSALVREGLFDRPIVAIGGDGPDTVYVAELEPVAFMYFVGHVFRKNGPDWAEIGQFGGNAWTPATGASPISGIAAFDQDVFVFAKTSQQAATVPSLHSFDGTRWTTVSSPISMGAPGAMYAAGADEIYFAGARLLQYMGFGFEDGPQRLAIGSGSIRSLFALPTGEVFIATTGFQSAAGVFAASQTGFQSTGLPGGANHVAGRSPTEVYAARGDGVHLYDGTSWTQSLAVAGVSSLSVGDRVLAGDSAGNVHEFDGNSWTIAASIGQPLTGASPIANGAVFRDGTGNVHVLSGTSVTTGGPGNVTTLWASSENDIYAGTATASLQHYDGQTWEPVELSVDVFGVRTISGTGPDDVWVIVNAAGGPETFHFDGVAWSRVVVPATQTHLFATPRFVAFGTKPADLEVSRLVRPGQ